MPHRRNRHLKPLLEKSLKYSSITAIFGHRQGTPLELTSISRASRISVPTLRTLLAAFEAMYLIRIIDTEGTEKKPVLFLEDQGEATYLARNRYDDLANWTRFLYANLRVQFMYRPDIPSRIIQYRTRDGAYIPLCFETPWGELGLIPMIDGHPNDQMLGSAL